MTYKALIVEDEPIAQDIIREYLSNVPSLTLTGVCQNAMEASEALKQESIDLLFLDIKLPKLSGLGFVKTLPQPPKIIITTAYEDYALEGYDLAVADYLLKPISFERFMKAVNKALYELDLERKATQNPNHASAPTSHNPDSIYVRSDNKITKIPLDYILYLEAYGNYVKILTPDKAYLSGRNLSHYAEKLQSQDFLRIHRSYVVTFQRIEALEGNQVLIADIKLPVSQAYKPALMERMQE
jgi:DNA-binding LytR/AlgR family response regulator